jgi:hypothetical protein
MNYQRFLNAFNSACSEFKNYFEMSNILNFWYSRETKKPWQCLVKELLHRHCRLMVFCSFILGCGLLAYWRLVSYRKYYNETVPMSKIVQKSAMKILHQAANSCEPVVAVDQLKETILSGDSPGLAGEKTGKAAWELGYSNLRLDRRVMALMKVLNGKNTPCLTLRSSASSGILSAPTPNLGVTAV